MVSIGSAQEFKNAQKKSPMVQDDEGMNSNVSKYCPMYMPTRAVLNLKNRDLVNLMLIL